MKPLNPDTFMREIKGNADLFRHREELSDLAIQSSLIALTFWIASHHGLRPRG